MCLSWQTMSFAVTKICLQQQNFCCNKTILSQQNFFVNKRVCGDKSMLIVTKLLLWQNYVCCDKYLYLSRQTNFCHDKHIFVITKDDLSWQTCVCCDMFVTTKPLSQKLSLWPLSPILGWMWDWTNGLINQFLCLYAFSALAHLPTHPYSNASSPKLCSLCWWCAMCLWKKPWRLLTKCLTSVTMTLSRWGDDPGKIHVTPTEHCWKDSTMGTANSSGHNCEGVLEFTPFVCISTCFFVFCF